MDDLGFALAACSSLFVVVDPIAAMPIFLAVTASDSPEKRRAMAARAAVASAIILAVFALAGGVIFKLFGISLGAFKVAGGIMLALTAVDLMRAQAPRTRSTSEEQDEGAARDDVAVVPMAIPVLSGPGAIATVMVLMSQCDWRLRRVASLMGAIALTATATWLLLRASSAANALVSRTLLRVFGRVMGLMLAAIAVQFVLSGLHDLLAGWASPSAP